MHNVMGAHEELRYHYRKYWQINNSHSTSMAAESFLTQFAILQLTGTQKPVQQSTWPKVSKRHAINHGRQGGERLQHNLEWGTLMQIVPPKVLKNIAQNSPKWALKKIFSWGGAEVAQLPPQTSPRWTPLLTTTMTYGSASVNAPELQPDLRQCPTRVNLGREALNMRHIHRMHHTVRPIVAPSSALFSLQQNVCRPRPSVCLSVCPSPNSHTTVWTRM